jgi:hypothetical protein
MNEVFKCLSGVVCVAFILALGWTAKKVGKAAEQVAPVIRALSSLPAISIRQQETTTKDTDVAIGTAALPPPTQCNKHHPAKPRPALYILRFPPT